MSYKANSTHVVEVVPIKLEKHPSADRLSVVNIFGYSCVVNTEQWAGYDKAAYVPPDSLVDTARPCFEFLKKDAKPDGKARIKAKKLRGILSFGLLVPAPDGSQVGDDVTDILGVTHYEPPLRIGPKGGVAQGQEDCVSNPSFNVRKYDLEAGRRYKVFEDNELCVVHEKIHGQNMRVVYTTDSKTGERQIFCGSRTQWKREYPDFSGLTIESLTPKVGEEKAKAIVEKLQNKKTKSHLWQTFDNTPGLKSFILDNPDYVVYGEAYGAVQDLRYGCKDGEVRFAAFDIYDLKGGRFLDYFEAKSMASSYSIPWVPTIAENFPFDFAKVCELAEGQSLIADHVREGVVVRPIKERTHPECGRVCLKWVGAGYLERS